jgi:hypothetical protein
MHLPAIQPPQSLSQLVNATAPQGQFPDLRDDTLWRDTGLEHEAIRLYRLYLDVKDRDQALAQSFLRDIDILYTKVRALAAAQLLRAGMPTNDLPDEIEHAGTTYLYHAETLQIDSFSIPQRTRKTIAKVMSRMPPMGFLDVTYKPILRGRRWRAFVIAVIRVVYALYEHDRNSTAGGAQGTWYVEVSRYVEDAWVSNKGIESVPGTKRMF